MIDSNQLTVTTSTATTSASTSYSPRTVAASTPQPASAATQICCEFFIDTLNKLHLNETASTTQTDDSTKNSDDKKEPVLNYLTSIDVISFLNYCHIWQQKQCVCVFTSDELIEKFHHFLHTIIAASITVIKSIPVDAATSSDSDSTNSLLSVKLWQLEHKEKLLIALVKIFTLNMPLYVTYKHLLFNHGRYNRINECSCSKLSTDSISLLYLYCQTNSTCPTTSLNRQHDDNLPIELMRNVSHFIDMDGIGAIKTCFMNSTSDNLPLQIAHILFNVIANIRIWLNPVVIEQQIQSIRSHAINFMCQLSDRDLRLVATKNTTELMYESFKELNFDKTTNRAVFKLDKDGLTLALKYLLCSTLTIRLCGIAQMNYQISAWSEFYSLQLNATNDQTDQLNKNDLADWFVKNKIIEQLFGPNLHVEVTCFFFNLI